MGSTSLVVIILTQTDKVILSKILDLKTFGYYTLAYAIASSLYRIIVPVSQAVYPRMVQLVHTHKSDELIKIFHTASQFIAAIVLPFALTISFFSKQIIMIWTHNAVITEAVHPLVRVLIIGTACNALCTIPGLILLAYGWTKLGFYQNVIAIIILIPSIIYLANLYGAYGAVWCWTILNACYIIFSIPIMFKKFLKTEQWKWYWNDIFMILLPALVIIGLLRLLFDYLNPQNTWLIISYCVFVLSILLVLAITSAKYMRENVLVLYRKLFAIKVIEQ